MQIVLMRSYILFNTKVILKATKSWRWIKFLLKKKIIVIKKDFLQI